LAGKITIKYLNQAGNMKDTDFSKITEKREIIKQPGFSELLHLVWHLFHHTSDLIYKCEEIEFTRKAGISHQHFTILLMMEALDDPIRAVDLARHLERSSNTMSATLFRMEKSGLIKQMRDLSDRRAVRLVITQRGREKLMEATGICWALIQRLLSSLSCEEMSLLVLVFGKMRDNTIKELGQERHRETLPQPDFRRIINLFEGCEREEASIGIG
jgi:DNA-binding MarR family transcriptional regulator